MRVKGGENGGSVDEGSILIIEMIKIGVGGR
jgi:hypothetical protein